MRLLRLDLSIDFTRPPDADADADAVMLIITSQPGRKACTRIDGQEHVSTT